MAKIRIEICIISARGLGRSSSLLKPQWFAVGWIDANNKYCTKIDNSGSSNPTWKTKFSIPIDDTSSNLQGLSLIIEVYRREPIFLREKLQGTATVMLKEFFTKFGKDRDSSSLGVEETGSFQLRKRSSGNPQGFVDISVRVFEEREGVSSYSDFSEDRGFQYSKPNGEISLAIEDGRVLSYPTQPHFPPPNQFGGYSNSQISNPYPENYRNPSSLLSSEGYRRTAAPPPPPPPSNTGFLPSLFPGTAKSRVPESYVSMPTSGPAARSSGPGFGAGLGAGALAAGAVIFGDDFLSGSSLAAGFDGGSLDVSTDPAF